MVKRLVICTLVFSMLMISSIDLVDIFFYNSVKYETLIEENQPLEEEHSKKDIKEFTIHDQMIIVNSLQMEKLFINQPSSHILINIGKLAKQVIDNPPELLIS